MQTYAKMVLDIMYKNTLGVRCLVTMESAVKPGELRHAFLLVTKVHTTPGNLHEANGMLDAKVIFASETIKRHAHIDANMWRSAEKTNMFFQPCMISENGNIKSHVSVQDLKPNNTCMNQTCKLPQCVAAILLFTGTNVRAAEGGNSSAHAKSGSGASASEEEEEEEEDEEEEDEEGNASTKGGKSESVDLVTSSSESENGKGDASKEKEREARDASDSDGYEIVPSSDPKITAAGADEGALEGNLDTTGDIPGKKRRISRNSLFRAPLELQPDEIAAAQAQNRADKAEETDTTGKGEFCVFMSL